MPQWGKNDQAVTANSSTTQETTTGAPIGTQGLVKAGKVSRTSGANAHFGNTSAQSRASVDVNMFGNVSPGAFISGKVVGVFGVDAAEMANVATNGVAHAGWNLRTQGMGPVVSFGVSAAGSGHTNGDTITVSGGQTNATGVITSNATSNMVSVAVGSGGLFHNSGALSFAFNREKHVTAIAVGGTPTGYSNTDVIRGSNGTSNALATVSTNSTGGFVTANVTITNSGVFANAKVAGDVVFTVLAANGSVSAGSGATFTATLANSTGGTVTAVLGGRAGRVQFETLVAMSTIGTDASDDTILPDA